MSIPPESIIVGRCYLTRSDQVVRIIRLQRGGYVAYVFRSSAVVKAFGWTGAQAVVQDLAYLIEREVPCDWTPETDE
jgi:hypothetical protein